MKKVILSFALSLGAAVFSWALELPAIFSDHAVLQSGAGTPVFGKAAPGATVEVAFQGEGDAVRASATADKDGKWLARLPELKSGQTGVLTVKGDGETKTFQDAIVGEVWICSGQSNMAFAIASGTVSATERRETARKEAAAADGKIRMFRVRMEGQPAPRDNVNLAEPRTGGWEIVTPDNVLKCTAVGWNFAVRLHEQTGAPVGILSTNWGGTCVEAWLSEEAIENSGVADKVRAFHEKSLEGWEKRMAAFKKKYEAFKQKYPTRDEQRAHPREMPREPYHPASKNAPSLLYNGMVRGLEPYGAAGILWYQGESNGALERAAYYAPLIQSLVKSWRAGFQNPDLAFYYVELANFRAPQAAPVEPDGWGMIREAQNGALALPKTGVATAIDVGVANDIHPVDKKTVGNRLAGMALNDIYGKKSLCRSPEYKSHAIKGDAVVVSFNYADGLRARGDAIDNFAVCGEDGQWVWADDVQIVPDTGVRVRASQVPAPKAVRYGWANNPKTTVENAAGLPLRPFRTDVGSEK